MLIYKCIIYLKPYFLCPLKVKSYNCRSNVYYKKPVYKTYNPSGYHIHLDKIAEAVKAGVRMAGGTPIEFPAIGVCDGIAMGHKGMKYSLATRELIADSIESMTIAHGYDGLVFNRWYADMCKKGISIDWANMI